MHIWVDADATPAVIKDILLHPVPRGGAGEVAHDPGCQQAAACPSHGEGGHALNPRGEFYSCENIRERLNMRDFMEELRGSGVVVSGPAAFSQADRRNFANQLDRFLARRPKNA